MAKLIDEFREIIGDQHFLSLLAFLKDIGPDARTHRICVVIASILRFAVKQLPAHCEDGSLSQALLMLDEQPHLAKEQSDEFEMVFGLIDGLCCEAGILNGRESAQGENYSISENAILEYAAWYNMPWEDY
ncbi:short-chain alcohol dehydrogenase [Candidatus Scalindua japonica]|uniref:Short-chain alcohol dehydrogenase n=1 Tax=Candidatus Scalindua japonica TaxID=1284222 RepID=A0A286TY82_9BACT|nr:hypothetical protein [Candidatus Scalindua japonica]GAX60771.1 short-chain alcohol dehydrogenase [Candidatus Scalindua japonica]